MKIRQEINLLDRSLTTFTPFAGEVCAQLDTGMYSGTPTYYFEVLHSGAASNVGTFALRRFGTTTDDATITGTTSATFVLSRVSFTPPAGATEYMVRNAADGTRSQTVKAARIIVLQNETAITGTQTQIEIGNYVSGLVNTTVSDLTNPKFWKYTAANWDGVKTFSVEVVYNTSSSNTCTVTLCRTSDNAANVTVVSGGTGTSAQRTRTTFTPVDGETYKIRCLGSTTKSNYTIQCAKIIVSQNSNPGCVYNTGQGDSIAGGTAASGESLQAEGQSFTPGANMTMAAAYLFLNKAGSPTDNLTLEILTGSITGTVIGTSGTVAASGLTTTFAYTAFTFSPSVSLSSGTKYYLRATRSGARDATNLTNWGKALVNILTGGGSYIKNNNVWGAEDPNSDKNFYLDCSVPPTGCEPQYLLLNTNDSNATGVQNTLTTWNSTEWDAGSGTITYKHAMDSDNASNSIKLYNVTDADDVTSTVTGTGQQVSSALTVGAGELVTGKTYDCWVLNTTGVIAASRVIVTYAWVASVGAAARRIFIMSA